MKILFDNGTPHSIARVLSRHAVSYARDVGWHELANGELIREAEIVGYDVLLTTDKNIRYQQNLTQRTIALVVLTNGQWPNIKLHLNRIADAVDACKPGTYVEVEIPFAKIAGRTI